MRQPEAFDRGGRGGKGVEARTESLDGVWYRVELRLVEGCRGHVGEAMRRIERDMPQVKRDRDHWQLQLCAFPSVVVWERTVDSMNAERGNCESAASHGGHALSVSRNRGGCGESRISQAPRDGPVLPVAGGVLLSEQLALLIKRPSRGTVDATMARV